MKKIRFVLAVLSLGLLFVFSACRGENADYKIEHSFSLNQTEVVLEVGQTFDIVASYGNETLIYTIDKDEVAEVNDSGKVTARKEGVAYVSISASQETRICKITVITAEYVVAFDEADIVLTVGAYKKLQVKLERNGIPYNDEVDWSATGGTLSPDGRTAWFIAEEKGEYVITVTSGKGAMATCKITVVEEISDLVF